jgi:hypothetical protein
VGCGIGAVTICIELLLIGKNRAKMGKNVRKSSIFLLDCLF